MNFVQEQLKTYTVDCRKIPATESQLIRSETNRKEKTKTDCFISIVFGIEAYSYWLLRGQRDYYQYQFSLDLVTSKA